ncbi:MAG: uroporphyrinogen-III C-methyltransferase [Bacillota bacterium]|uniref:Uroporphyrinogen-III C-methyltransferase n=1 Tax=Virgibacillus salarius TaxID=447199 RepID=A0A941IC47_9BACI|nr:MULTISPECIES: uroporphyrinogen-III C-methyltransferase [Bacillaceae]NAZ09810.1 uroporphyrinogen-III C-methyltransferase [Agaribacter marinus]MBR7797101.1 uroporphyrinogen-III C-methyltransferase [Virgibacillus salarius]MCC2251445.1 uroporphyrinogen-III C-methyltransferase [Virgibacillus sp. AGTR]MDY7044844.1 uroporphyrinogen-III C-methyltransferase [Virgibacillus sp. M23]QRZ18926.1 uroporphyrinogen-III C-methyltransferase [Virgibacillus sp. AGTR]
MGKVYLVGAGPGDPDLITVKGAKIIGQSDVILYDRLVNEQLLEDYAPKQAELIYCGKRPDHHALKQEQINQLLWQYARQGKVVTRLKGGDPFIFGRGGEEALTLGKHQIPFEIVPGITSGSAAPAYAGIPLTHRQISSSVAFVSGVTRKGDTGEAYWEHLAKGAETLCIYMGVKNLPDICHYLIKYGRDATTPIAVIHYGTTQAQQTITGTLHTIATKAKHLKNPSMIIIGEVVRLREQIKWFEGLAYEASESPIAVIG